MASFLGFLWAVLAAVCNGSFAIPSKLPYVKRAGVSSFVFNLYTCLGILITGLIIPPIFGAKFGFSLLGLLSGALFALSTGNAYLAIGYLGVSVAQGIWCGVSIIVAFLFGEFFQSPVSKLWMAIIGLVLLLIGVIGVAYIGKDSGEEGSDVEEQLLEEGERKGFFRRRKTFLLGLLAAVLTGILGGLIIAPQTFASSEFQGFAILPAMGVGAVAGGAVILIVASLCQRDWPAMLIDKGMPPGLLAGVVWNIANALSIVAIKQIGYAVAYPVMQCGLFIAGLWGIIVFKEIRGRRNLLIYAGSGVILAAGIVLLALSK